MNALERFRRQYRRNLESTRGDLAKACAVAPRKFRGYTVADLEGRVADLERLCAMTDQQLQAWLAPGAIAERATALREGRRVRP